MSKPAEVLILGEDPAHVNSVYRAAVEHLGVNSRRVRILRVVAGKGDAKKFVLQELVNEASALRRRPTSVRLIVCLDTDGKTVERRCQQIKEAAIKGNLDIERINQQIVQVIPKRNSETWLRFGIGDSVDEESDYKKDRRVKWTGEHFKIVGKLLGQHPSPNPNPPPALDCARQELRSKIRSS